MDVQEYRERSYKIWQAMAAGWQRQRAYMWDVSRVVGEWLVAKLEPQPGQTILELAAGVGDTGFAAASRLGDSGRLVSTDFSSEMVEAAKQRAAELGIDNAEHRVMDAENMDLSTGSVDGVLCRWGYMLMADPTAAFAETRRVLREGGRLCFAVWAGPERNPWAAIPGALAVELRHMPMPEPDAPGIFAMGDPARVRELVVGAGFSDPEIEEVDVTFPFENIEQYWRYITELAGALAMTIRQFDDDQEREYRELLEERVSAFGTNGGYRMPGTTLAVVTT